MKLSVIIPAYNAAPWLGRCIRSLEEGQALPCGEYELLIVDDGSTDGTLEVAREMAEEFPNIRVMSQRNSGPGAARNAALDVAEGDYVFFVDADDAVAEGALDAIAGKCCALDLDLLQIAAANVLPEDGSVRRRVSYGYGDVRSGSEILLRGIKVCTPFTICRRALLGEHSLRFLPGIFHEDAEFLPRLYYHARRVAAIDDILYLVYLTPGSVTRTPNPGRIDDMLTVMESLHRFCEGVDDAVKPAFHDRIASNLNYTLHLSMEFGKDRRKALGAALKERAYLLEHLCKSSRFRWKAEGALFRLCPTHVPGIYGFFFRFVKPDPES